MKKSIAAAAFALFFAAAAQAGPYSSLVVFGDSLSDNGNNAAVFGVDAAQTITNAYVPFQPYGSGVYSNGPVWASYFATMIGVPLAPSLGGGTDYAAGGATTGTDGPVPLLGAGYPFSLRTQASAYLGTHSASSDALYVVAGGGNNARAALAAAASAPAASVPGIFAAAAASFASDIGSIVDSLQAAGAAHILVWNTPNLGTAPAVASAGAGATGSFLAGLMNSALSARLEGEAGVSIFDIFGLGSAIAATPGAFGFTDVGNACGGVSGANCDLYEYWDGIHPTTAAHRLIADAVYAVAVPVPEPETWALMAVGLAALGAAGKRRWKARPAQLS